VTGVFYDKMNQDVTPNVYNSLTSYQKILEAATGIDASGCARTGYRWIRAGKKVVELTKRRHDVATDDKRRLNSFNMALLQERQRLFIVSTCSSGSWPRTLPRVLSESAISCHYSKGTDREIGIRKRWAPRRSASSVRCFWSQRW